MTKYNIQCLELQPKILISPLGQSRRLKTSGWQPSWRRPPQKSIPKCPLIHLILLILFFSSGIVNRMVKESSSAKLVLNNIFHSLSDPTRRKILELLTSEPLTVTQIKQPFKISLVAISKHLKVLERSKLIRRQKMGREYLIRLHPQPLRDAHKYIEVYKKEWTRQLDALEKFLERNS